MPPTAEKAPVRTKVQMCFWFEPQQRTRLQRLAKRTGRPIADLMREAVEVVFARHA